MTTKYLVAEYYINIYEAENLITTLDTAKKNMPWTVKEFQTPEQAYDFAHNPEYKQLYSEWVAVEAIYDAYGDLEVWKEIKQ